jgi:hypothetical protein
MKITLAQQVRISINPNLASHAPEIAYIVKMQLFASPATLLHI